VAIDLAGLFSTSSNGNQYVLVVFDYHSKFRLLYPLATRETVSVAVPLLQCFCTFGFPKILQSDNGTKFVNEVVKEIIKISGIDRSLISPYYPQSNG
jgi:transposase InsO family protein